MPTLRQVSDIEGVPDDAEANPAGDEQPASEADAAAPGEAVVVATGPPEATAVIEPVVSPEPVAEPVVPEESVEPAVSAEPVEPEESPEPVAAPVVSASAPEAKKRPSSLPPPPPGRGGPPDQVAAAAPDAGKVLGGIATVIGQDEVELVLEDGRLAVIHRRNYAQTDTEDLTKVVSQGDRLEGAVLAREDPRDRVVLSRSWGIEKRAWERLTKASEENEAIECLVTGVSKNGLVVDADGIRGFVPMSHVAIEPTKDLASFNGQRLEFKIIELDANPQKRRLVLSRRSVLLREQRREAQGVLSSLVVGETRTGRVDSLSDYGAFVDLGGVNGLVHVSELAWTRVKHPSEVVQIGDEVEVKVLEVKVKKRRVRLSLREVSPDPLAEVEEGSISTGRISRLVDFGAFVDLGGVEGLVHLSELAEYRVSAPEELVTPGEEVMVKVLSVDLKRRRIELSIRQAISDQYG